MSNRIVAGLWVITAMVAFGLAVATVRLVLLSGGGANATVVELPTSLPLIPTAAAAPTPTSPYHDDPLIGQTIFLMGRGRVKLYKEANSYLGLWSLDIGTAATVQQRHFERPWWYRVDTGEYVGWIERENMAADPSGAELPEEEAQVGYLVFLAGDEEIPMYQQPDTSASLVTMITPGVFPLTKIEEIDDSQSTPWYAIQINQSYGWISSEHTSLNPPFR